LFESLLLEDRLLKLMSFSVPKMPPDSLNKSLSMYFLRRNLVVDGKCSVTWQQ